MSRCTPQAHVTREGETAACLPNFQVRVGASRGSEVRDHPLRRRCRAYGPRQPITARSSPVVPRCAASRQSRNKLVYGATIRLNEGRCGRRQGGDARRSGVVHRAAEVDADRLEPPVAP